MKLLRIFVSAAFVIVGAVFLIFLIKETITTDRSIPVITIESDVLEVELKAKPEDMLVGVTAHDKKDGDITSELFVESISRFTKKGECNVTYVVCDSDNHVTKATRKIRYKNYTSPKFVIEKSLCFSAYDYIDLTETVKAVDCIEGDISGRVVIASDSLTNLTEGIYNFNVSVTNKYGDTSLMRLPVIIDEDLGFNGPQIELTQYLIEAPVGTQFDPQSYFVTALDRNENDVSSTLRIEHNINSAREGTYYIHYYTNDEVGNLGHAVIPVIIGNG